MTRAPKDDEKQLEDIDSPGTSNVLEKEVAAEDSDSEPHKSHSHRHGNDNDDNDVNDDNDHDSSHHGRLSTVLSRIASNASSALRRHRPPPAGHLAVPPVPLMDLDRGIVGWDSPDDPELPLNFRPRKKWLIILFLSVMTLMTPFASSSLAPSITYFDRDLHNDSIILGSLAVTLYLLGYAIGPLFLAGLSEIYGRHIVLVLSSAFFCVWQIGCALTPSIGPLIVFRLLAGIGGSACITLGGAYINDLFPLEERGLAMSLWTLGPLIGPSVGPIAGAWIAQTIGWRWNFWIILIPGALTTLVIALFSSETSSHVIIKRKLGRLSRALGRDDLRSCYDHPEKPPLAKRTILLRGLVRPLKMLLFAPVVLTFSLYVAFIYGVLYLLFNTVPMVFQDGYGWSIGIAGLAYIPLGLGYIVGLVIFARVSDRTVVRLTQENGGVFEPEMRLVDCIYFACCLPVTFFWYGWSAYYQTHWIVPVLGLFPYGFAAIGIWLPLQSYIVDFSGFYAASGLAAFAVLRSIVAAFLPLAGPRMYASLGLGWGNSLLGFICVALIPVALVVYRHGKYLRGRFPINLE